MHFFFPCVHGSQDLGGGGRPLPHAPPEIQDKALFSSFPSHLGLENTERGIKEWALAQSTLFYREEICIWGEGGGSF